MNGTDTPGALLCARRRSTPKLRARRWPKEPAADAPTTRWQSYRLRTDTIVLEDERQAYDEQQARDHDERDARHKRDADVTLYHDELARRRQMTAARDAALVAEAQRIFAEMEGRSQTDLALYHARKGVA